MKVFGIYRRLVANQDGVLHELWDDDEEWAIARKDALAGNQPQYHWYMCPLQVKSASKRKESRPTVRRVRPCNTGSRAICARVKVGDYLVICKHRDTRGRCDLSGWCEHKQEVSA